MTTPSSEALARHVLAIISIEMHFLPRCLTDKSQFHIRRLIVEAVKGYSSIQRREMERYTLCEIEIRLAISL
jgi:hypothetical protein